ncbi:selenocysteine-specific elongation factor isoform X3 [Halyomorpha halys]|uniref:selenocysteine-specific elongation factor isoform X3 n=1 Tax=Halyomorpha halys TaxID=286706 RepID=UPI0006D506B8|nr:selenocysteine-specific elongation factor isoform X3 [Halyomorpha halys]
MRCIHIIDYVILVIDITKGIQTQTAECLVISEITNKPLLVVLNKTDLIDACKRDAFIKKISNKIKSALSQTIFQDISLLPIVCKEDYSGERGIDNLITKLTEVISVPCRSSTNPLVLAIDHCFSIKGKGTVITGTILQGKISLNDIIEIPGLQETKKVKSIQMFKQDVSTAVQGDRIGTCVTHFNPKQLERGIACRPGYMHLVHGVIINFNKVKYYKNIIKSNTKYHVSVGYETLIGKLLLFQSEDNPNFNLENEYLYVEQFNEEMSAKVFALLEFEKSIYFPPNSIIICSKLDANINCNTCRISFFGNVVYEISDKRYPETFLPKLKIYKVKIKTGYVQSLINENEIIAHKLFQKITSAQKFLNMKIKLSTGETGYIESTFGQKDKIRIRIPEGLQASTFEYLSLTKKGKKNKVKSEKEESLKEPKPKVDSVTVRLEFKRYMFDKHKTITQHT